jgi:hypothetical protein
MFSPKIRDELSARAALHDSKREDGPGDGDIDADP